MVELPSWGGYGNEKFAIEEFVDPDYLDFAHTLYQIDEKDKIFWYKPGDQTRINMMDPSSGSEHPMSLKDNETEKMLPDGEIIKLRGLEDNKGK